MTIRVQDARDNHNDREPTDLWLNVGLEMEHPETGESMFIGLPVGIPLDPKSRVKGNSILAQMKNSIFDQIMDAIEAAELAPGEAKSLKGLSFQIRRVAEAVEAPANSSHSKALGLIKIA